MARQFIYHMQGLTKTYPGDRKVLENIHLSFYPDAKIGVLGVNGSGKSTLLRIMAGIDKEFVGEGWVAEGARVGYLQQEPQLDPAKIGARERHGGRRAAEGDARPLQRDRRELLRRDRRRDDEAAGRDRRQEPVGSRLQGRPGDGRAALPARRRRRRPSSRAASAAAWRCASCCSTSPTCCCSTSRPTISTPRSVAWLEGHLRNYPGAILIVTHDRYFLDNVTGWILELDRGRGIPYEGNYSSWLEQKQKRLAAGRPRGRGAPAHARSASRNGSRPRPRRGRRSPRRAIQRYEDLRQEGRREADPRPRRSSSRWPSGSGRTSSTSRTCTKGYRRQPADRRPHLQAAARRHRRRHRAERRRQDHAVPHDHRPGEAGRRHHQDRRVGAARLCRPVARRARRQQDRLGGDLRRQRHHPCSASAR